MQAPVTIDAFPQETALRLSHPTQLAAARAIQAARDEMVSEWTEWSDRRAASRTIPRPLVERGFQLITDTLVEMLGPLRREAKAVWAHVMEHYGRTAAARGLAAGEVVEEFQQLRLILIRHIGDTVASMRPRRAVAVFLRLNGIIDQGIAVAVVGYTDALVASLLMTDRNTQQSLTDLNAGDLQRQLDSLEAELRTITARR